MAGPGTVHLTGNIIDDEPDMMDMMDDDEDSEVRFHIHSSIFTKIFYTEIQAKFFNYLG